MKRTIILFVATIIFGSAAFAQDTTVVQTLSFTDITKRSGTYAFPSAGQYEKILMYYTLKCDPQTTRDGYNCGEWDYLTYTMITDSTGRTDTTVRQHPNFMVGDLSPDKLTLTSSLEANKLQRTYEVPNIDSMFPVDSAMIGTPSVRAYSPDGDVRFQMLFTARELSAAGLKAGDINALQLFPDSIPVSDYDLEIFVRSTSDTSLTKVQDITGEHNFYQKFWLLPGNDRMELLKPFTWDGTSSILVELRSRFGVTNYPLLGEVASGMCVSTPVNNDNYFEFTENTYIDVDPSYFAAPQFDSVITISFWAKGSDILPKNTSIMEAVNSNGDRVLNIHMPWSNSSVYWDAGRSGNNNDRINKAANDDDFKGKWNHWAFTKNTNTGNMMIYLNGQLWASGTGKTASMSDIAKIKIGENFAGNQWYGYLDQFRVWSRELSQQEISALMNSRTLSGGLSQDLSFDISFDNVAKTWVNPHLLEDAGKDSITVHGRVNVEPHTDLTAGPFYRPSDVRPAVIFHQSNRYDGISSKSTHFIDKMNSPVVIELFDNTNDPTARTGYRIAFPADSLFTINLAGDTISKTATTVSETLNRVYHSYETYAEHIDKVEIGRFITPYGIGLDLGPQGFRWVYDVTDYAYLLTDNVTLSAGNQQELIDLKFLFIKGTPPRDVKKIHYLANRESRQYGAIADDVYFKEDTISLLDSSKNFKLVTRITGHGHQGNVGNGQIHCCEWANKNHHLLINGQKEIEWDIWQNDKCALNAVMDQGGNWSPPRAGWCPGAPVDDYNFDLTDLIGEDREVRIDYGIEPVPADNPGQSTGNYVVSLHLIEYGDFNHQYDAAVEQIISPTNWEFYQRLNPTCTRPIIRIINRGEQTLTSADIKYGVVGGNPISLWWEGELGFMEYEDIEVPYSIWDWVNESGEMTFFAEISNPNGKQDENPDNDRLTSAYVAPDLYKGAVEILYRNNKLEDATITITNDQGEVVYENLNGSSTTLTRETLNLDPGCYKMEVTTENGFGLAYPLIPEVGTGLLRLIDKSTNQGKLFNNDFGKSFTYHFTVTYGLDVPEKDVNAEELKVYPNPSNGLVVVELNQPATESVEMVIFDAQGRQITSMSTSQKVINRQFDLTGQAPGVYLLEVRTSRGVSQHKIIIQ